MRRTIATVVALAAGAAVLGGCAHTKATGFGNRNAPNEFVVTRNPPLVIPPDFALRPPRPGQPRPQEASPSSQALAAMFGGQAQLSPGQQGLIDQAGGAPEAGIRSGAGSPSTNVVDKGSATKDILAAPTGNGDNSTTTTPQ
jgi:predicted small secreted protein